MATSDEKIAHTYMDLEKGIQLKLGLSMMLLAQRLGEKHVEQWGYSDLVEAQRMWNTLASDTDLPVIGRGDPDDMAFWQEMGEDDEVRLDLAPQTMLARDLTTGHAVDVEGILDFFDRAGIGAEYSAADRITAADEYQSIVADSDHETHKVTGEKVTVLHTSLGSYSVPSDLQLEAITVPKDEE